MAFKKTTTDLRLEERKALIDFNSPRISVRHQCEILDLPRSTAYYSAQILHPDQDEIDVKNAIDKIHFDEPAYGCRRILIELHNQDFTWMGKKRTRRYMEEMGSSPSIQGLTNLSKRDLKERTYPYLLRGVSITYRNQVWGIDITYCGTPSGFMYLVVLIDWHSRFVGKLPKKTSVERNAVSVKVDKKHNIKCRVLPDEKKQLKLKAIEQGKSLTDFCSEVIKKYHGEKVAIGDFEYPHKEGVLINVLLEDRFFARNEKLYVEWDMSKRQVVHQIIKEYLNREFGGFECECQ